MTSRAASTSLFSCGGAEEPNSSLAAQAFPALAERWQTVLWQSEVEQLSSAQIGDQLVLAADATAALTCRARQGLPTRTS